MNSDLLRDTLTQALHELSGDVGVYVKFLNSGEEIALNSDAEFWAASVIKIPIACEVYHQAAEKVIDLSEKTALSAENKVEGTGIITWFDDDAQFSLHDLVVLMLTISDNTATNQLIDIIGWESVEEYMAKLGLTHITFRHKTMIKEGRGPNMTTAREMGRLLELLYTDALPGSQEILSIMSHEQDRTRIHQGVTSGVRVATKSGSLDHAHHSVGIVYGENPFVFVFLSDDQKDKMKTNNVLIQCVKACCEYNKE